MLKNMEIKKMLVVNDNIDITSFIKQDLEYLYPSEYYVICVNCRNKCFKVLIKSLTRPDVILFDISMPKMKGWEVFDYLKRNFPWKDIPIISIIEESYKVAKNFGKIFVNDFIEKPFEINDLKVRIERVLV